SAPLLGARATAVRQWLAAAGGQPPEAVEPRVAASVAHLGLAARLVSPALALAVLHARPLAFALDEVRWRPVLGGPVPLALPAAALGGPQRDPDLLAEQLAAGLLAGPLEELAAAFARFGVSWHILRGNTASAVNGAALMLARARPERAARAREFAASLLARPPLAGAGGGIEEGAFRRRSCCLIYRAAPDRKGALCGDCALHRPR
ncbi:FhuF 2Fe-2S C-terminal domain-containing protein, partial [Streptomyces sp. DvalAA-14]|uniref:(2Fe-2S)-binding protein n=1 Tax=unclassified Streptomyces TaxID=2593676 RepID=UPI00081B849F